MKEQGYRVTYDSEGGNHFKLVKSDGTFRTFTESKRGLYYLDTMKPEVIGNDSGTGEMGSETEGEDASGVAMINTVAGNRSKYTNRAYLRAVLARKIQHMIGRPSTREFIQIVEKHLLPNCPISRDDIMAAEKIFGPDTGILKGKTVRKGPEHVDPAMSEIGLPSELLAQYRNVVVGGDIMFINKLPFFCDHVPQPEVFYCGTATQPEGRYPRGAH